MIPFTTWCEKCVTIKDKVSGNDVPFVLNAPQRRLVEVLEADRVAGRPMRIIVLKARQWGASTVIQAYMAYMQLVVCRNWHSIICSQVKDTSANIRGMYSKILENYPREFWHEPVPPAFRPFEGSRNIREIAGRGCRVAVSSIVNQDSVRGNDFAMAHLSEAAFWPSTPSHSPEDLIRAVCGAIAFVPNTLIAMESTANGVGNFFHREWLRCAAGEGDKRAIFVPWYEIDAYSLRLTVAPDVFEASLDSYERALRDAHGCSLEQINWYRSKRREYPSHELMMAEYPTTPVEAFANTGSAVFSPEAVALLRDGCRPPLRGVSLDPPQPKAPAPVPVRRRRLSHASYLCRPSLPDAALAPVPAALGAPMLPGVDCWQLPVTGAEYIAAVDIGGRSPRADFSVIAVLRVDSPLPEVVAQWRGHADCDRVADTALALAEAYSRALLVVEANSLDHLGEAAFVLDRLQRVYPNLYCRESGKPGFHTNTATKQQMITNLIIAVRDRLYIERDSRACDELAAYCQAPDGTFAAQPGHHDDILITRAIALHLLHPS